MKSLNKQLIENTKKMVDMTHLNETLTKEKEDLENERNSLSKNLIKANEHNKLISKELKEEKLLKYEEAKTLTDQLNEKQLEINDLQNELETLNRNLEISNLQTLKSKDNDVENELNMKLIELAESERKVSLLQDRLLEVQKKQDKNERNIEDAKRNENKFNEETSIIKEQYQKNETFEKQYNQLLVFSCFLIILSKKIY